MPILQPSQPGEQLRIPAISFQRKSRADLLQKAMVVTGLISAIAASVAAVGCGDEASGSGKKCYVTCVAPGNDGGVDAGQEFPVPDEREPLPIPCNEVEEIQKLEEMNWVCE